MHSEGFLFVGSDVTVDASRFGKLQEGMGYMIQESSKRKIFDIVNFLQIKGYEGIFFSRGDFNRMHDHPLDDHLHLCLYPEISFHTEPTEEYLADLFDSIKKHILAYPKCYIVIERLDYLLTHFRFDLLLRWFYVLSSLISQHHAILFLHVSPGIISEDKFTYLQSEFSTLPDQQIESIALEEALYEILIYIQGAQSRNILVSYQHIGKKFNISKVTTKRRIDDLEKMGLISVMEKGRMKLIALTAKGETLLNKRDVL
jgi:DNA-binding MarR family transcriptional regulator